MNDSEIVRRDILVGQPSVLSFQTTPLGVCEITTPGDLRDPIALPTDEHGLVTVSVHAHEMSSQVSRFHATWTEGPVNHCRTIELRVVEERTSTTLQSPDEYLRELVLTDRVRTSALVKDPVEMMKPH